jgi:FKBP-type peptidyl-prolyl cis-trans isomerase SlyD
VEFRPVGLHTVVSLSFTLRDERGEILDVATPDAPLRYLHGASQLLPALERALEGKVARDRLVLTLPPEQAWGPVEPRKRQEVPRSLFPAEPPLAVGMPFVLEVGGGEHARPFFVRELRGDVVVLDGNHPLAGRTLCFDLAVEAVRGASPEEIVARRVRDEREANE